MNNSHKIEDLIERFFQGITSNEEEKELYKFFSQENIPAHLTKYKPVFEYFNEGIIEDAEEKDDVRKLHVENIFDKKRKKIVYTIYGIAAAVMCLLSIHFILDNNTHEFEPFEGSYIVRNGVRITDMDIIRHELEQTYQEVMQQQKEEKSNIENSDNANRLYYDTEQKIREEYYDLLEQITDDEYTKNEIKRIFRII